jgi:hypothetical protein
MHAAVAAAAAAAAACMRACVAARVIDTVYQLIYSSAQTWAWRIEFSYRDIHEYWGRSKGRARRAAPRTKCTFASVWQNIPVLIPVYYVTHHSMVIVVPRPGAHTRRV